MDPNEAVSVDPNCSWSEEAICERDIVQAAFIIDRELVAEQLNRLRVTVPCS